MSEYHQAGKFFTVWWIKNNWCWLGMFLNAETCQGFMQELLKECDQDGGTRGGILRWDCIDIGFKNYPLSGA